MIGLFSVVVLAGAAVYAYPVLFKATPPEAPGPQKAEIVVEKPRKQPTSKENNRDIVSSQHLQVKRSWENPGVYVWGSNSGRVADPDSDENVVKTPRRMKYFDGQLLRDLKLDRNFGAALTENGDLVQWGIAFSTTERAPSVTLKGKNLVRLALSRDRILALSSNGTVYSIPVSKEDQDLGARESGGSWLSFWSSSPSAISYRTLQPQTLGWNEKINDISSGLDHCLLLTSAGRVFSAAASSEEFPSQGQLGIPGLTWATRPKGPFDQPHEYVCCFRCVHRSSSFRSSRLTTKSRLHTLRGFQAVQIATGDYHSLVLDDAGRVFSFGDNSAGQLGFEPNVDVRFVDVPSLLPLNRLYGGTGMLPKATFIAAGGNNSFFTVDATKILTEKERVSAVAELGSAPALGRVVADTWACGEGIHGSLGTGKWTHVSRAPNKIKALSNLFEFDEAKNQSVPIRLANMSVGATHAAAIMDNVTNVSALKKTSEHDCNWGADVVWWGGNVHYQLGTGKRNNVNAPMYIGPLDGGRGDEEHGRKGEAHRFQITPRTTVRLGEDAKGRKVSMEQRVECGRYVTAVYSGT